MHPILDNPALRSAQARLNAHPVYNALSNLDELRCFMRHHVYAVWDFMSLLKYLQHRIAPAVYPWLPHASGDARRFINAIVLAEESDQAVPAADGRIEHYLSHFELYCAAMREIGADAYSAESFVAQVGRNGLDAALRYPALPTAARRFMQHTFSFIASDRPHVVAAAFALGREEAIPEMFRAFLRGMGITQTQAPAFYYYLERHIHLDEDEHGPLALRLLDELCDGNPRKQAEASQAAVQAIEARIEFWDGVLGCQQQPCLQAA